MCPGFNKEEESVEVLESCIDIVMVYVFHHKCLNNTHVIFPVYSFSFFCYRCYLDLHDQVDIKLVYIAVFQKHSRVDFRNNPLMDYIDVCLVLFIFL